ncbi:hypothetical protein M430DRAFT_36580 [Amorphotheca resinae ATCC 22711]|uniref:Methyltransferase domain-containing protein n=1 Tax=Amorphotheca resinae ATCC 22711 TaxID=857342 RepID=A0A2T3AUU4_AMORE|nr:hypothetical protein M430DRAFT_36580 [Amorphotheca resinae ATCC 22711]PSS12455.1 hypothetical protein M430DRAFT_36580 [Amorphotheca resinae ATCC 22711]
MDPKALVQEGYDNIAPRYLEWTSGSSSPRMPYLQKLLKCLPARSKVLELGCGAGKQTRVLSEHCEVTANDVSAAQIQLARQHAPDAVLIQGDMMELTFPPDTFHAVVALYSIIHLPRSEQALLLKRTAEWLEEGGYLLMNLGTRDDPGTVASWLDGCRMYWSGFDAATNREMVRLAGFELVEEEITQEVEDGVVVPFLWMLAKKKGRREKRAG